MSSHITSSCTAINSPSHPISFMLPQILRDLPQRINHLSCMIDIILPLLYVIVGLGCFHRLLSLGLYIIVDDWTVGCADWEAATTQSWLGLLWGAISINRIVIEIYWVDYVIVPLYLRGRRLLNMTRWWWNNAIDRSLIWLIYRSMVVLEGALILVANLEVVSIE